MKSVVIVHMISLKSERFLDINECEENNGNCQHQCVNIHGSFHCECNPGFQLTVDGVSCEGMFNFVSRMSESVIIQCYVL